MRNQHHQPSGSNLCGVSLLVGGMQLTFYTWWGFQCLRNNLKDMVQNIIYSPWGGTKDPWLWWMVELLSFCLAWLFYFCIFSLLWFYLFLDLEEGLGVSRFSTNKKQACGGGCGWTGVCPWRACSGTVKGGHREGVTSDWPVNQTWPIGSTSSPPLSLKYTLCPSGYHFQESSERRLNTEEFMLLNCGARGLLWVLWSARRSNQSTLKGNQPWIFIGRTDTEAKTPVLWPPDVKCCIIGKDPDAGKDWGQEEKGATEDKIVRWYHWLNGHEFEQTPGDSGGQGSLACCRPWGHKELDTS